MLIYLYSYCIVCLLLYCILNSLKFIGLTEQEIYLERYDWTVHVMCDVHSKDAMKV